MESVLCYYLGTTVSTLYCTFLISLLPLVLKFPLLQTHSPTIDWANNKVTSWSLHYHQYCLQSALPRDWAMNEKMAFKANLVTLSTH